jgi:hypothetical protein
MAMKNSKLFNAFGDLLIITIIALTLTLLAFLPHKDGKNIRIVFADGSDTIYSLSENAEIEIESNGYHYILETKDGKARIATTDCPSGFCKKSGDISRGGESIICAPGKLVVIVSGESEANYDAVAQ